MINDIRTLQRAVGRWHRATFGEHRPDFHVEAIAQKAQEEAGELRHEAAIQNLDHCEAEVADLLICALAAADRLGMDAAEAIYTKLDILKAPGRNQVERDRQRGIPQASEMGARDSA